MKYAIMCGGSYGNFDEPKQFTKVRGERLVARTIRLLRELGQKDIVITSNNPEFDVFGVPRIEDRKNNFSQTKSWTDMRGWWLDAFHDFKEPCCYLFGDVFYSDKAMKTIVDAKTDDSLLFGSDPTSSEGYLCKTWYEPFAFKVVNHKRFFKGIDELKELYLQKKVKRHPIAWELYRHLQGLDVNSTQTEKHFVCINDVTTDIDNLNERENDVDRICYFLDKEKGKCRNLKKVFGVVSYLPSKQPDRNLREERLTRMFRQIHDVFGDVDWLVVAQNWGNYEPPGEVASRVEVHKYDRLGILKARKELRKLFLQSKYDYIIMLDDDVILQVDGPLIAQAYMDELNMHPNGFYFPQYKSAQLNMCAISRHVYEMEPMVDVDPQNNEGYEDTVFSNLLRYKYPNLSFDTIHGFRCTQFHNPNEKAPSTWSNSSVKHGMIWKQTKYYLEQFKKGNFAIDKMNAYRYACLCERIKTMLFNGWITKEEVKRQYGIDIFD